jgi:hypothetical protein
MPRDQPWAQASGGDEQFSLDEMWRNYLHLEQNLTISNWDNRFYNLDSRMG